MARDRVHCGEKSGYSDNGGGLVEAETLRRGAETPAAEAPKGDEKIGVFWRVFGGTLLSIVALVFISIFNNFNNSLSDLRRGINDLHGSRADLLRKDEFNNRLTSLWTGLKEVQQSNQSLYALNERSKLLDQQVERQIKTAEEDRRELHRRLEEQRKALEDERKETQRRMEEFRKVAEGERADLVRQLQEQRRAHEEERKELARKVESLTERLAKVETRTAPKTASVDDDE